MAGQSDNRYGDRDGKPLVGVTTPVSETKASLTIQTALKIEAKLLGNLGNYIKVQAISSGGEGMSISNLTGTGTQADPYLIEIKLGTTTTNNTMTLIAAAIVAKTDVNAIVNAIVVTGATQMTAFNATALSGGVNGDVGYLYEVRGDANDIKWTMVGKSGDNYLWSPDGFPANGVEYPTSLFYGTKRVYKKRVIGTTGGALTTTIAHNVANFSQWFPSLSGAMLQTASFQEGIGGYTAASTFSSMKADATNITVQNGTTFYNSAIAIDFYYIKT